MNRVLVVPLMLLMFCPGCAAWIAARDTDDAISIVATANLGNVQTAARDKVAVHDVGLAKVEVNLQKALSEAKDGTAALKAYQAFQANRVMLIGAKDKDVAEYAKAIDNAVLLIELIDRKRAIVSGWDRMLGRIPGMDALKAQAELEARKYTAALTEGSR